MISYIAWLGAVGFLAFGKYNRIRALALIILVGGGIALATYTNPRGAIGCAAVLGSVAATYSAYLAWRIYKLK